jgi:hypothetical protein
MKRFTVLLSLMCSFFLVALTCSAEVIKRKDNPAEKETTAIANKADKEKLKQIKPAMSKDKPKAGGAPRLEEDPVGTKSIRTK